MRNFREIKSENFEKFFWGYTSNAELSEQRIPQVWLVPGFSPKNVVYYQNIFFSIEIKIKMKSSYQNYYFGTTC